MRVAHSGDFHLNGLYFNRCSDGLDQISMYLEEIPVDYFVISGDVFQKYNVADKYKTTGELQGLFINFINRHPETIFIICPGNHDMIGTQKTGIEFLKNISNVIFVEKPDVLTFEDVNIGILPWIEKGTYYSKNCKGLSKTESEQKFTEEIHKILGYFKSQFEATKGINLLFGHIDIAGTKVNKNYIASGVGFSFTSNMLESIGANYYSFSHIHKRVNGYVGSPWQQNFGEEGNSQGFEVITIENGELSEEYINIEMPEFVTVTINQSDDIDGRIFNEGWLYKLRFNDEVAYNWAYEKHDMSKFIVEKLFNKRKHVARTENEITPIMSDEALFEEYVKINNIPKGIELNYLKELIKVA